MKILPIVFITTAIMIIVVGIPVVRRWSNLSIAQKQARAYTVLLISSIVMLCSSAFLAVYQTSLANTTILYTSAMLIVVSASMRVKVRLSKSPEAE